MNSYSDVSKFMMACDQKETGFGNQSNLYMKLINEEFSELVEAICKHDMVEIADACADLKWVIEGLEHTLQIPQQSIWDEVARSNLSKISETGKVLKRADGKVIKPETFSPPNLKQFIS
jgi:predicted HAD superfamily Cof-like phosphohydrolase